MVDVATYTSIFVPAGSSMIVALWGEKSASPLQAMHMGFPIGSMIAPLIALPYVSDGEDGGDDNTTCSYRSSLFRDYPDNSEIEKAFMIVGICTCSVGVLFIIYQFAGLPTVGPETNKAERIGMTIKQVISPSTWSPGRSRFGIIILVCMTFFYILHKSTFHGLTTYHALYAVESNFTTEREATLLSSSMSLSGAVARALSIGIARVLPTPVMVSVFAYGESLSIMAMTLWGLGSRETYWAFCCIFAFFREPVWPAGYGWTNTYIVLYAVVLGIMLTFLRLVESVVTWLYGYTYEAYGKDSIFKLSCIFAAMFCIHVVIMNVYAIPHGTRFKKKLEKEGNDIMIDVHDKVQNVYTISTKL